jgi:Cdc6-like AAA superfamily ATPase
MDKKNHFFNKYEEKINHKICLYPKLLKQFQYYPSNLKDLKKHLIFYGASGVGKYTLALKFIKRYSASKLKYEKKMLITSNKNTYSIKISDVHYEIDMSTLGCNSKTLWHDIFIQIVDTISLKKNGSVIILCKAFHEINIELLEIFYSYFQHLNNKICFGVDVKYILLTEHLTFIPDNILKNCECISIPRPSPNRFVKCFQWHCDQSFSNIAEIYDSDNIVLLHPFQNVCNSVIEILKSNKIPKLIKIREYIYDMLIYNLNIHDCCWYILSQLEVKPTQRFQILILFYKFFHFFNNNYRPIYHFEWLFFSILDLLWR